jgi:hypothetical protein
MRPSVLSEFNFMREKELYRAEDVDRTYSSIGQLNALKYSNIQLKEIPNTNLLNAFILTSPARAQSVTIEIDGTNTAGDLGAKTIVLHAGRIPVSTFFSRTRDSQFLREKLLAANGDVGDAKYRKVLYAALSVRKKRAAKATDVFLRELESIMPALEKNSLALALENLPFLEGYPNEVETLEILTELSGSCIFAWYDTGHHRVREMHGWIDDAAKEALEKLLVPLPQGVLPKAEHHEAAIPGRLLPVHVERGPQVPNVELLGFIQCHGTHLGRTTSPLARSSAVAILGHGPHFCSGRWTGRQILGLRMPDVLSLQGRGPSAPAGSHDTRGTNDRRQHEAH